MLKSVMKVVFNRWWSCSLYGEYSGQVYAGYGPGGGELIGVQEQGDQGKSPQKLVVF